MRDLRLPPMTDDIVVAPRHALRLPEPLRGHRIHVSPTATGWQWAHLLRAVSGWKVIAAGVLPEGPWHTTGEAAEEIARRFKGDSGDGCDRLPADRYVQIGGSTVACLRREDSTSTYCGDIGGRQAVFDRSAFDAAASGRGMYRRADHHCIHCDATYRAEHYGRMALPV